MWIDETDRHNVIVTFSIVYSTQAYSLSLPSAILVTIVQITSKEAFDETGQPRANEICEDIPQSGARSKIHLSDLSRLHMKDSITSYIKFRDWDTLPLRVFERWWSLSPADLRLSTESVDELIFEQTVASFGGMISSEIEGPGCEREELKRWWTEQQTFFQCIQKDSGKPADYWERRISRQADVLG